MLMKSAPEAAPPADPTGRRNIHTRGLEFDDSLESVRRKKENRAGGSIDGSLHYNRHAWRFVDELFM
jgi:hypothetical protein